MLHFEDFWTIYPRKIGKKKAEDYWKKLIKKESPADLIAAVTHYAKAMEGKDQQFIKYGSTFLGPGEWWRDWVQGSPDSKTAKKKDKYEDFYL